jgi:phosphotransferase system enzyme I (PtsP)
MLAYMGSSSSSVSVHVHHRGERGVDGILRLIDIAGEDLPLEQLLTAMCAEIADLASADVVSVYVRETRPEGDVLVMRGNMGFPASAIGTVSLKVGEGLTGMVAECMRPVSVGRADADSHYKHVPGLGEERYPAFVGVPLLGTGRVAGVLVLQRRRAEAFSPAEIALTTALGAPMILAIDRSLSRARDRARGDDAPRSARLAGMPIVGGTSMGRAAVVPTLAALPDASDGLDLAQALDRLRGDLDRAGRRLRSCDDPDVGRTPDNLALVLMDQRFRERIAESGGNAAAALRAVARDYARVPYRVAARGGAMEPALAERAREIEDLCVLLWTSATRRPLLPPGGVWLTQRLGAFVALCAAARGAAAVVVDGVLDAPAAAAIARAAGIPVLAEVDGLFAWTRPGDLLVVDADAGSLRVNPAATAVEHMRSARER